MNHLITNMVFNVSTDIMMMCIPLPLLIRMHLPIKKYVRKAKASHESRN